MQKILKALAVAGLVGVSAVSLSATDAKAWGWGGPGWGGPGWGGPGWGGPGWGDGWGTGRGSGNFGFNMGGDLSGRANAYLRRVFPSADRLGPVRLLSHRTGGHRVSAHAPSLAVTDSGLLATWVDAQRGQGYDVWFRTLGPTFDEN